MQDSKHLYDDGFYKAQMDKSYISAKEMLGYLNTLLPNPKSVIDVGCGVGTWLKAWSEINEDMSVFGIDGNDVSRGLYQISLDSYQRVDLTQNYTILIDSLTANTGGGGG